METGWNELLKKWPKHAAVVLTNNRPVLVLSRHGLTQTEEAAFSRDYNASLGSELVSVIISIKMMHVYFSRGGQTFDYRPHRGPFSGITIAPYRMGKTDRAECIIRMTPSELKKFDEYVDQILVSPSKVLGSPHALSLTEPDFTVRSHRTRGTITDNRLLDAEARHNCLTWMTTAPVGEDGQPLWKCLGMKESDLFCEAHSYIVAFHDFLLNRSSRERVPAVALWTHDPLDRAMERVKNDPDSLRRLHAAPGAAPQLEASLNIG